MKIKLFVLISLFIPAFAFAADSSSGILSSLSSFFSFFSDFADSCSQTISDVDTFLSTSVPSATQRFFAWAIEWSIKIKFYMLLEGIQFAYGIAKVIWADLNLGSYLTTALSFLPSKMQYVMNEFRIADGLTLILHAHITKFVLNFLGLS